MCVENVSALLMQIRTGQTQLLYSLSKLAYSPKIRKTDNQQRLGTLVKIGLLSDYVELNVNRHLTVEFDLSGVVSKLLDSLLFDEDDLAVNVEALLLERLSDLDVGDRTEDFAGRAGLSADGEGNTLHFSSEILSVLLNLSELVCTLLKVLSEFLASRLSCEDGDAFGDKIVATVARLDRDDVVLVTELRNVSLQNNFHCAVFSLRFTSTGRLRRAEGPGDEHALQP